MVRVRFAPSPTGALHIGGVRTALFNYLFARHHGGSFVLRIDDTDRERSLVKHERDILSSLTWLGLNWDEGPDVGGNCGPYRQSERTSLYLKYCENLLASQHAYRDDEGVVRLRYPGTEIVVNDLVCGRCSFQTTSLGPEPVLIRSDGNPTYHLASVVDDIEMGITHVIRGQDHLTNTAKHSLMFAALTGTTPQFAHLPLILGEDGAKLSKRNSESLVSVREFREKGYLPQAIINFLMLLGWSHPEGKEQLSLDEGVGVFGLDRVGHSASIFETRKLSWLNAWWIRHLPLPQLLQMLPDFWGDYRESFKELSLGSMENVVGKLRDEFVSLTDIQLAGAQLFDEVIVLTDEARSFIESPITSVIFREVKNSWMTFLSEVPCEDGCDRYSESQIGQALAQIKKLSKEKKPIFQSLRILTLGSLSGPELKLILPLVPRQVLVSRSRSV